MNSYSFQKDDRLHSENARLRKIIEKLQSEEYLSKLMIQHAEELRKKEVRIASADKKYEKIHDFYFSAVKKLNDLKFDTSMKDCEVEELQQESSDKTKQIHVLEDKITELQGIILKLTAQLNRDYENSSIPSSQKTNHKIIKNSRVKTELKPGAQHGHIGHGRKRLNPTEIILIPAPSKFENDTNYYETGKIITKQVIDITISTSVIEYQTKEYRNHATGVRVHAPFPKDVVNDVSYGSNIKSLACILNNYCNVSIDKTRELIHGITDGNIQMSKGMINQLGKEFSLKTESERRKIYANLLQSSVMYSDATSARVNGVGKHVILCANKNEMLYFYRENKGHKGLKDTPVEDYLQTIIHDHDITYYNYGSNHQECLSHVLRYLQDSIDNESKLTWNQAMKTLLAGIIHEVKSKEDTAWFNDNEIICYEKNYMELLNIAETEYKEHPPSKYYRDGYNLYKRMKEYQANHLLFLHDKNVDYSNNLSERQLRKFKRKQKQAVTFRSGKNVAYICDMLSIIETRKCQGLTGFQAIKNVYV